MRAVQSLLVSQSVSQSVIHRYMVGQSVIQYGTVTLGKSCTQDFLFATGLF